ncbi:MAG TPA: TRAP transporter TatT component family protein [Anaeromyxobacteraceae bacterium]|nr:TRAP transporter TatT component family protein [Anaeromyxobacteraceae bacterium]
MLALLLLGALAGAAEPPASPRPSAAAAPAAPTPASSAATALAAGAAAYVEREDPARLAEALQRFREAAALAPSDPAPLVALARAEAWRGLSTPAAAREAWGEAARAAERALHLVAPRFGETADRGGELREAARRVEAPGAEPLYWLALATMGMGRARGMTAMLSVKDAARALMERAAALDERVDFGGPRRALGAWLATIPSAAGGGAAAARAELDRARELAPDYQLNRVRDAETLSVLLQDRARFERLLGEVIAFDPARAPAAAPENRLAQRLAKDLLARRDRLF